MQDKNSPVSLSVSAPARLHLGFLDLNGSLGRRYGSVGLAVDAPSTEITASLADDFEAVGPEQQRVLQLLKRCSEALGLTGRYRIEVNSAIPAHAGLGSGTQLALAIGTALMRLEGLTITPQQIGDLAGRGARSAIGIAAFEGGGFIVDGGRGKADRPRRRSSCRCRFRPIGASSSFSTARPRAPTATGKPRLSPRSPLFPMRRPRSSAAWC